MALTRAGIPWAGHTNRRAVTALRTTIRVSAAMRIRRQVLDSLRCPVVTLGSVLLERAPLELVLLEPVLLEPVTPPLSLACQRALTLAGRHAQALVGLIRPDKYDGDQPHPSEPHHLAHTVNARP